LEWFKDFYCQDMIEQADRENRNVYQLINEAAEKIPAGSERLIYMPYLMGERTPHMNPKCRGAFVGLNIIHQKSHLLRAIMEGIAYSLADCNALLKETGTKISSMKACGGGSKSKLWRQILADLYECEIQTLAEEEGPAYGAAILAGVGTGVFPDVSWACRQFIKTGDTVKPDSREAELYKKYHAVYDSLYCHMTKDFEALYEL
jgi:xylulokinase